jgi:hypothetical protein
VSFSFTKAKHPAYLSSTDDSLFLASAIDRLLEAIQKISLRALQPLTGPPSWRHCRLGRLHQSRGANAPPMLVWAKEVHRQCRGFLFVTNARMSFSAALVLSAISGGVRTRNNSCCRASCRASRRRSVSARRCGRAGCATLALVPGWAPVCIFSIHPDPSSPTFRKAKSANFFGRRRAISHCAMRQNASDETDRFRDD